jgi:hypothetical protein
MGGSMVGITSKRLRTFCALLLAGLVSMALLPAGAAAVDLDVNVDGRESRADINIRSNDDFTPENGVRSGSGTADDPYEISGWNVFRLYIADTDAHVLIHDNTVRSQMILNWIGPNVEVHHNDVRDLRVNQNVRRTGAATSGVIAENNFDVVGQLRHWDGVFEDNVVGSPSTGLLAEAWDALLSSRAVNFDGFNGARFRNNTIYGYMDVRLHGHHHSSEWGDDSHHHGMDDDMDHTHRYHEVSVTGNRIYTAPAARYGLGYLDTNHAANDRTANSEENPALNDPHIHYTRVRIADNELVGSGIRVNVFNANDARHIDTATGEVAIEGNRITLLAESPPVSASYISFPLRRDGIWVNDARDVEMSIRGNVVAAELGDLDVSGPVWLDNGAGIYLNRVDLAQICLVDNSVSDRRYGIQARSFSGSVDWIIDDFHTHNVDEPVEWNTTVQNLPHEGPHEACDPDDEDDDHDDGDEHGHHDEHDHG